MELDQIERIARASREFTDSHDGVTVTIRIPTRHETRAALAQSSSATPEGRLVEAQRSLLLKAIVAWSGVLVRHLVPDVPEETPVDHAPLAVQILLDAQPDWADRWQDLLAGRMAERRQMEETAEKKSLSASPGAKPKPMRSPGAARSLRTS